MLMSSKNLPGYALTLKGGTTGRRPVLPRVFFRQYRSLPEVLIFGTDVLGGRGSVLPGVCGTTVCSVLPDVVRYYRDSSCDSTAPSRKFLTSVLMFWEAWLGTTERLRYYRVIGTTGRGPVLPRFFLRQYRVLPEVLISRY